MSRIQIEQPPISHFTTDYPILITDVNAASHMGAERVLAIVVEAQSRFFRHQGYTRGTVDGTGQIMVDAVTQFLGEARYGDILRVDVSVTDIGSKTFAMVYCLTNQETEAAVARVRTTVLCYDYERRCAVPVPDGFGRRFSA